MVKAASKQDGFIQMRQAKIVAIHYHGQTDGHDDEDEYQLRNSNQKIRKIQVQFIQI